MCCFELARPGPKKWSGPARHKGRVSLLSAKSAKNAFLYCQPVKPSKPKRQPDGSWLIWLDFVT